MYKKIKCIVIRAIKCLWILLIPFPTHGQKIVNMELVGVRNYTQGANDIWGYESGGTEYAILGLRDGTAIIDISTNPASPAEVAFIAGPNSCWRDIKTFSHYAYVVHDCVATTCSCSGSATGVGLQIIDLNNPSAATVVNTYATTFQRAHNIFIDVDQGFAYVAVDHTDATGVRGMHILNLADPVNPVEVGFYADHGVHDVYVKNNIAYAANLTAGLFFLNVSDKSNPVEITHVDYPSPNLTHNVWVTDDENYALTTDELKNGPIRIWDIQDLSSIAQVASYQAKPDLVIHNVLIKGNFAYISYYAEGVVILNIADPAQPCEVGYYDTHFPDPPSGAPLHEFETSIWGVYPFTNSGLVFASDIEEGLKVFRFTYDALQVPGGTLTTPSCPGICDGSIDLTAIGGQAPYSYIWSTSATSEDISSLCAGTYAVTVTDDLGCTKERSFDLPDGEDNTPPSLSCPPDITVICDTTALTGTETATATDDCDPAPLVNFSDDNFAGFCEWACNFERTWVAADAFGNTSECVQLIEKNTLPLIAEALSKDIDGDGIEDPLILGTTQTTLTIGSGSAHCMLKWLPGRGGTPAALNRGKQLVNSIDCTPGTNPIDGDGRLSNPLLAEVLKLAIILRLYPDIGEALLSDLDCEIHPVVLQTLRDDARVNDLMQVANIALGNLVLVPHLNELWQALICINEPLDVCNMSM